MTTATSLWPPGTLTVCAFVHGEMLHDEDTGAKYGTCGVWFFEGCALNQSKALMGAVSSSDTVEVQAVLCAAALCEPLMAEWPREQWTSSSLSALTSSSLYSLTSSSLTHTPVASSAEPEDTVPTSSSVTVTGQALSLAGTTLAHTLAGPTLAQTLPASRPPTQSYSGVKTFSAGVIAPYLPEPQRRPVGSSKQAVAVVLFTTSEHVCKSLAGRVRVNVDRPLLLPLQVLTKDFNVFVLRCGPQFAGMRAATALARAAALPPGASAAATAVDTVNT